jgi:hypothetical protein
MKRALRLFLLLMFFSSAAFAARPLATDDAGTVDRGHLEVEAGFEFVEDTDREYTASTVFTFCFFDGLDIGVELPYHYIDVHSGDDVDGPGDIAFSSKWNFFQEQESLPALSFVLGVKTTSGDEDKGLGSPMRDHSGTLVASKAFGEAVFHINLGYTYAGIPETRKYEDVFSYGMAMEYPLVEEKLNLVAEWVGETNFDGDFDDNPFSALIGITWAFSETAVLDFGAGAGISKASPDYFVTSGITLAF